MPNLPILFDTSNLVPKILNKSCTLSEKDFIKLGTRYFLITKPIKIKLKGKIQITQPSQCFVIGSDNVTISGKAKCNIQINTETGSYFGLIMNGDRNTHNKAYSHITIKNILIDSASAGLAIEAGWIGHTGYGYGAKSNKFIKCTNRADLVYSIIPGTTADTYHDQYSQRGLINKMAGIVGSYATCILTKCKNYGNITGNFGYYTCSSGILGQYSLDCILIKCKNYGNQIGNASIYNAGLVGPYSRSVRVIRCVNRGNMVNNTINTTKYVDYADSVQESFNAASSNNSGIVGSESINAYIIKSKNYGTITNYDDSGAQSGIIGSGGTGAKIIACVNYGIIQNFSQSNGSGGITGNNMHDCVVSKCINRGDILNDASSFNGGISGGIASNNLRIIKCVNIGNISGKSGSCANGGFIGGSFGGPDMVNYIHIDDSINKGSVYSEIEFASGFIGGIVYNSIITNSVNRGKLINSAYAFYSDIGTANALDNSRSKYEPLTPPGPGILIT